MPVIIEYIHDDDGLGQDFCPYCGTDGCADHYCTTCEDYADDDHGPDDHDDHDGIGPWNLTGGGWLV